MESTKTAEEFKGNKCPYGCGRADCRLTFGSFKKDKKRKK
jgi:hypothetical protein